MIYLPVTPADGGAMLIAYLQANPSRSPVAANICARLDAPGRVGDTARFYIIRTAFRRAVFRGMLLCIGARLPSWAKETPEAAADNRAFITSYRDEYLGFRRAQRTPGTTGGAPLAN